MLKRLTFGLLAVWVALIGASPVDAGDLDISETVVMRPIADGVSMNDAIESMKLRANNLNMMFVAHQPLSRQIMAMGFDSRRIEIFQFCDPLVAKQMVEEDMLFAAYMPCRIALVEDKDGRGWLVQMDLDYFTRVAKLTPESQRLAHEVRDKLAEIVEAGINGEL
ncbi:MAG: DUF302 domain-containing protein [Gammaproteobacteria bacterium]|nr:DUF302 domain-containing protein [Gammaproteobacteria bacterium]MCP5137265.1 DUF302 domain-containing protein [Gammaproteobacteria bacterium]